ncbi:MAG: hypothetical protein P8107_15775, partial [Spirochaetia bacterium]
MLELFADLAPKAELDKMIAVGQKRLKQFQHSDGGWSWWYSHDSDPFITAYVVEYLLLADDTGFNIDKTMLKKARGFFEDILERATRDNKIICLYALSLLQSEKGSQSIISLDNLDPDILALAVMHNIRVGEKDPEKNGLNRLIKMAHARGNTYYWDAGNRWRFGSRDASTALAIRAITYSGENRNTALQAGRFLMRNRIRNYWSNTFATAQVVRSLVELSDTADESSPEFDY